MTNKRSTKFYRKNEADVMSALGFIPTVNSGAGWIEKEDGQNEYLISQLKSTDADSIRVQLKDITILEYNATVAHKVPCFVLQFIQTGDVFVMARPNDLNEVAQYITTGHCRIPQVEFEVDTNIKPKKVKKVKSSESSREEFWNAKEKENEQWKKNYKRK